MDGVVGIWVVWEWEDVCWKRVGLKEGGGDLRCFGNCCGEFEGFE
jgi:hypothetical protein